MALAGEPKVARRVELNPETLSKREAMNNRFVLVKLTERLAHPNDVWFACMCARINIDAIDALWPSRRLKAGPMKRH